MRSLRGNRRVVYGAISVVALLAICLVGFLMYSIFTNGSSSTVAEKPTAEVSETDEGDSSADEEADTEAVTATPTKVLAEATDTPAADEEEADSDTVTDEDDEATEPTATPTSQSAADFTTPSDDETVETVVTYEMTDLLTNGNFEAGFNSAGVAEGWNAFQNDGMLALYMMGQAVYTPNGESTQRIIMAQASQSDRYAGISQPITVTANMPYTLTMHGEIRSSAGDIETSSYGYRMQYALDESGNDDWQKVADWTELPWDEIPLTSEPTALIRYTTVVTPVTDTLTLFVRGWNKWPIGEAHYTVDNISLVGPTQVIRTIAATEDTPSAEEAANFTPGDEQASNGNGNDLLPVTGNLALYDMGSSGQFGIGLFVLMVLTMGVGYRWWRYRS